MAETRSKRMIVVLQLAFRAEEGAAKILQQSRHLLLQAEQQLLQVTEYQKEYITDLNGKTQKLSAQSMINDRMFLQRLGDVLITQEQKIEQLKQSETNALNNWKICYQRRRSIESLIERLKVEENALTQKLLQKEMDEFSSMMHAHQYQ